MDSADKVKKVIEMVRERLQYDGGDIQLIGIEDGVVKVKLQGACAGCPMSQMTLKNFVEVAIKKEVPGIKRVEAVK
jgi:Fe-S cluster biogenesis protein NfuA